MIEFNKNIVYELLKTLYVLKTLLPPQYKKLSDILLWTFLLTCIIADHSIFINKEILNSLMESLFVDDIKIRWSKKIDFMKISELNSLLQSQW